MCGLAVFLIILALALVIPASWMMGVVRGTAASMPTIPKESMCADTCDPTQTCDYTGPAPPGKVIRIIQKSPDKIPPGKCGKCFKDQFCQNLPSPMYGVFC